MGPGPVNRELTVPSMAVYRLTSARAAPFDDIVAAPVSMSSGRMPPNPTLNRQDTKSIERKPYVRVRTLFAFVVNSDLVCQMGQVVGRRLTAGRRVSAARCCLPLSGYVRRAGRGRRNPGGAAVAGFALICW
jgi:hypothetical protein